MNLHFDSTHNFRQVYPFGVQESDQDETGQIGNLYRSSRPDFMEDHEVEKLQTLGVKTIIDLRSTAEYKKASGHKRLDQKYKVREVLLPEKGQKYKPGEKISWKPVNAVKETTDDEEDQYHHYLINFFNFNFISTLFLRLPWYMKIYGVLVMVYDLLLGTHLLYFSRIMFRYAVNDQGLIGQYIDMAELSNTAICSGKQEKLYFKLKIKVKEEPSRNIWICIHELSNMQIGCYFEVTLFYYYYHIVIIIIIIVLDKLTCRAINNPCQLTLYSLPFSSETFDR